VLTLVGKPGCGLCVEMRAMLLRVLPAGFRLEDVDVRDHPDLERRYVFEIPVLLHQGRELARHRLSEGDARAVLEGLRREPDVEAT
jgi:glutaredoxin